MTTHANTPTPITMTVTVTKVKMKNAVEAMAIEQGHHQLKFTNKKDIELGNSDWIAGVDYDNPHQNNNNEEESDSDDSADKECTPDLEQCRSKDNSSDDKTCDDEDTEEEMEN